MHGTWKTTGGGFGGPVGLVILGAVLVGVAVGIAEAVAEFTRDLVFIGLLSLCALVVLAVVVAAWVTVYRLRHGEMPWAPLARRWLPEPVVHELPGPERPAVGQAMPRELHQHTHYHWHGAEPPAEILRRPAGHDDERR